MIINTDYAQVRDMARNIGVQCLAMLEQARELSGDLARLKKTLGDDGMEAVDRCVNDMMTALDERQQDMVALTKHLMSYADGLAQTK